MHIEEFLVRLGIAGHPGLRVDVKAEGYRNFTFGCRAGPSKANIQDLAHELAHAAQFGARSFKRRAKEHGFAFKLHEVEVAGRYYVEPQTAGATLRELETFAYQAHLMEHAGVMPDLDKFLTHGADLMVRFMPDWYCIPGENEAERKTWCAARARRFYKRLHRDNVLRRLNDWLDATAHHLGATNNRAALAA